MFKNFNLHDSSPTRIKQLPYRQRLNSRKQKNLVSPDIQNSVNNLGASGFDPMSDLKAKIMKAIMSGNDSIERQMFYKREIMRTLTPRTSQGKQYKINFNIKNPNERRQRKRSNESRMDGDQSRLSGKFQQTTIAGNIPMVCESLAINKNSPRVVRSNLGNADKFFSTRSRSLSNYATDKNKFILSLGKLGSGKNKISIQLKPWNSIKYDDNEWG